MKDFKKLPKMADGGGVCKYENGGSTTTPKNKTRKPNSEEKWHIDFSNSLAQTPVDSKASMFDLKNNLAKTARDKGVLEFKRLPEEVKNYEAYKNAGYKRGGKVTKKKK